MCEGLDLTKVLGTGMMWLALVALFYIYCKFLSK